MSKNPPEKQKRLVYILESNRKSVLPDDRITIDNFVERLKNLKTTQMQSGEYSEIYIDFNYDYDTGLEITFYGERLETDKEFETRLKIQAEAEARQKKWAKENKERQEKSDRKLYERLKKKYEGK